MRKLKDTLPSPSELDCWNTCQFKWLMEYRQGVTAKGGKPAMMLGRAVSDGVGAAYSGKDWVLPFEDSIEKMVEAKEVEQDEKWVQELGLTRKVLRTYMEGFDPERFGEVLGVQVNLGPPDYLLRGIIDLVTKVKETGRIRIVDQKCVSGWTDIEFENMKYALGSQPGLYAYLAKQAGWDVDEVVIDYLIKGKPASGRYKATEPRLETFAIPIEDWKIEMALNSAQEANNGMESLMAGLTAAGTLGIACDVAEIPRRVINCIKQYGMKKFPCDFYPACSVNMHPMMIEELFGRKS